jgi:hypothetical protein
MRGGKRQRSFDPDRAREAAPKSAEARRRKREQAEELEPLTDREQAMAALRRALDGGNHAAAVAAAKALIEFDTSDPRSRQAVSTEDARELFFAKLEAMAERQADWLADHGLCPLCERPVSRAEAEALMARHGGESGAGWFARITWKPVPAGDPGDRDGDTTVTRANARRTLSGVSRVCSRGSASPIPPALRSRPFDD